LRGAGLEANAEPLEAEVTIALELTAGLDETRNDGEIERELLLRPEAEVLFGRDVRQCWPTARFV
jgi:hypothetical protein